MTLATRCFLLVLAAAAAAAAAPGIGCGNSWQQGICQVAPAQFSFSDGCNTVTCDGRGEYITTLMNCPDASSEIEKRQCANILREVQYRVDSEFRVTCPMLTMGAVCSTATSGFTYNDGCNTVTCDGTGSGISTLMFCAEPEKPAEFDACDRRAKRLLERLEPRTCRSINATSVCLAEGVGFKFSDGCNTVECALDGNFVTTLMQCDQAKPDSLVCRWAAREARVGGRGRAAPSAGAAAARREFACPALAASNVCTARMAGFRYSDGCNLIHCMSPGSAVSTLKFCPPADATETAAQTAYCSTAQERMEQRRNQSESRAQCLTAADVCKVAGERKSFFDGCNYCFCMGPGRAGCTRRACRPYFSTAEEFQEECRRRKAGIIN